MELTLKGTFTADGSFKVSGMLGESEQTIKWPVVPVALAALPDLYLETQLKILASQGLPPEQRKELIKTVLADQRKLKARVSKLQGTFEVNRDCR